MADDVSEATGFGFLIYIWTSVCQDPKENAKSDAETFLHAFYHYKIMFRVTEKLIPF